MTEESNQETAMATTPAESAEHRKEGHRKETLVGLREDLTKAQQTASRAIIVAGVAILAAVTGPLWSSSLLGAVGATDPATARVLVLAVEQLRPALTSSSPFEHEIMVARRIMSDDREMTRALDELLTAAPVGVPTLDAVRGQFVTMANGIYAAELFKFEPNGRWVERAVVRVASVVRLHDLAKALEVSTAGPASTMLADAAHKMAQNDLAGAIAVVQRLPEPYAPLTRSWLNAAQARLKVARVLDMLDSRAARIPASFTR